MVLTSIEIIMEKKILMQMTADKIRRRVTRNINKHFAATVFYIIYDKQFLRIHCCFKFFQTATTAIFVTSCHNYIYEKM